MPSRGVASYPRGVTTPSRAPRARAKAPTPADQVVVPDRNGATPADPAAEPEPRLGADPDGGTGDVHELLKAAVDEAARLLDADGAMVYLVDPATGHLRFAHDAGIRSRRSRAWVRSIDLPVGVGMFGRAVADRAVVLTRDYLADPAFAHAPDTDRVVRDIGIQSMVVAPLVAGDEVYGAMGTFSSRPDAFSESDIALVRALADHAAASMSNAGLIAALDVSRRELAERADVERSLREIAARISAATDLPAVLQLVVKHAGRLVHADGVILDLLDPATGNLHWALDDGLSETFTAEERAALWISVGVGATGTAVAEDRVVVADDDLAAQFPPSPESTAFYERTGFHSMIAAPITGESGPLGVVEVYSRQRSAFTETDASLVGALASQAAIAITNARLIEESARSRGELARAADAERTLREIAGRVSATHDQDEILQAVIDASVRLLGATGAMIDLLGDAGMAEAWTSREAGVRAVSNMDLLTEVTLEPDAGVSGRALRTRQVEWTGSYLEDDRFEHTPARDAFVRESGIRSVIAAPLIHRDVLVGAITVYGDRPDAFGEADAGLLAALADQASVAIANARLIDELERSRAEVARRADSERTLREIAARVSAILEPAEVLDRVVEEAKRLLGTDGAHLTRMGEDGTYLVPVVVAGGTDPETQAWLLSRQFPLGGGINGLAAQQGRPVWTSDYGADPRIPHDEDDVFTAERLGLTGMAAAPLRAPGGEVIGTLAISSARPRTFDPEELDLLQGLADQAAIAITNTSLLTRLTESEERYRYLIENAPDMVWSIGADARLTFVSDAVERMTGVRPDELLGRHFGAFVHESSREVAEVDWTAGMGAGSQEIRGRVNLLARDGSAIPAEFIAIARLDESGRFIGANGSVRDMRERDRLERELRDSEIRYRTLASSSPDLVFATDAEGRYTFLSDRAGTMLGWDREASIGRHFSEYVAPGWEAEAAASYEAIVAEPTLVHTTRIDFKGGDGRPIPLEINVVGSMEDGRLSAIHGVARDVSERERLELELHESEDRYRFLVENSPDVVFSTDAEGHFTFMSESMERMSGWRPDEIVGDHFSKVVEVASHPEAMTRWAALVADPNTEQVAHINLQSPDGRLIPVEVSAIGMVDVEGQFVGIHGSTRDISERARLERDLRRQAGELAAGEERAHLARELHDSVTQALFSMTLVSRSIELLLDRDADAAKAQLAQLRDLQREALAEMRALVFELRPGNLEQDGLTRALRTHTAALQGRIGLPIVVESTLEERLPLAIEEVLYRISQEALHNVVKHAGARQVRLEVGRTSSGARLRIQDDGKGFDPTRVPDGHLGLAGMRARADKIGARFSCTSVPGQGTTIEVVVPVAVIAASGAAPAAADPSSIRDA
jgi:PAS domain S-box-containing protein